MRTMRFAGGPVAAAVVGLTCMVLSVPANAASAAYCALYAREYATARVAAVETDNALSARQRLEDQAFSRCLNLDVEPEFPATSVYYGQTTDDVIGVTPDIAEGDASFDDETPAAVDPPTQPAVAVNTTPVRKPTPKNDHDAGWNAWCQSHYPNSFDPKTGTVLPFGGSSRVICPR